jgi:branched-chain amino acid transport system ATP-binding protein
MLKIRNVSTFYGHIQALQGVSLEVAAGEIVSLVGGNGAGKSTLLNTVSGIVSPCQGEILLDEQPIHRLSPEAIVGRGVSQVPERRQVFGSLTVHDNLLLGAYLRLRQGRRREVGEDVARVFNLFPRLQERQKQLAGTLSGGEQQMLAIGRGLMARPKVLLFDEPSLGLAPLLVQEIFQVIRRLRAEGTTVLLVEQNAHAALAISDRGYVLEAGQMVMDGSAEELIANEEVQKAYLGRRNNHQQRPPISANSHHVTNSPSIELL